LRVFTVNSQAGSRLQYRAAAFSLSGNRTLIVAVPLSDVDQTLQRLTIVELSVGSGVVLALAAIGWLVVGLGLRPLERMRIVASDIARGDLSQRVKPANQRTEVGRLGDSLNEMLGQIEIAFDQRTRSEDRLRRFLADASHELRTPLASIRGYAELFRMGAADDPEALSRAMARIESEAARMGTLVEELLLLANLDEVPEPTRKQIDLALLVEQAAEDTRAIAPERPVSVHGLDTLLIAASADQLRQVLANLTRNALMHTPAESAIELSTYRRGDEAVVEVRDHGPGLPDGSGELVFDRFWRAEPGHSRSSGGVGLGLAIVSAIVRAHHGRVDATNAPDGGAVFRVILPVAYAPTTANAG
jgi:two-component system OmpR family sensor kinase